MKVVIVMYNKGEYSNQYTKENYDRVTVLVPKGKRAEIKRLASLKGLSTTQLIIRALEEVYSIDLS